VKEKMEEEVADVFNRKKGDGENEGQHCEEPC